MAINRVTRRLILLSIVLLCVTACSSTRFAYRHADWLINWVVDDYVELDRRQQSLFDAALDTWLPWHCAQEMPRYQEYLQDLSGALAADARQGLTDASLLAFSERALDAWSRLVVRVLDDTTPILQSLDDKQVAQILAESESKNQRFYKDYVAIDASALEKLRVERVRDAMKRWAGSISNDQRQLALAWAQQADNVYGLIHQRREQWRGQLAQLFADRSREGFAPELAELLLHPERLYAQAERDRLLANQQAGRQFLLTLERTLSQRQREHLLAEIDKITEDIERLSASECRQPDS